MPLCTACPEVVISDEGVTIGEDANTVRRFHAEWNELNLWLQDEPLREEKVVGGLELGGKMALAAHIARGLQIEEVRGEALNAEGGPIARGP